MRPPPLLGLLFLTLAPGCAGPCIFETCTPYTLYGADAMYSFQKPANHTRGAALMLEELGYNWTDQFLLGGQQVRLFVREDRVLANLSFTVLSSEPRKEFATKAEAMAEYDRLMPAWRGSVETMTYRLANATGWEFASPPRWQPYLMVV